MYKRNRQDWMKHIDFIMLDLVCLHIAYIIAFYIRHGFRNPYGDSIYFSMLLFLSLMDVLMSIFFSSFKNVLKRGYYSEFRATLRQVVFLLLCITFYLFAIKSGSAISRAVIYVMSICYAMFSYTSRLLWKQYLRKRLATGEKKSLLIVTTRDRAAEVVKQIQTYSLETYRIADVVVIDGTEEETLEGIADGDASKGNISNENIPILPHNAETLEKVSRGWVDEAFVDVPQGVAFPEEIITELMTMGVVVHINIQEIINPFGQKQFMEKFGNYTVLTSSITYASSGALCVKRLVDICAGLVGSLITLLLTIVVGPMIYIQSPGPIFFAQTRVGKNGKKFKMYKFRSMYLDAEERKAELMKENRVQDGMMFKLEYDPRIIGSKKLPDGRIKKGVGNFIRDWSLDEFPQFFNILKGDMSLVGTRPPTVDEWEKYALHHRARLAIKPGLTGLWQVSGRSNITDFEEVVKLDSEYIADWNLGKDVKIILLTFKAVFKKDGAM